VVQIINRWKKDSAVVQINIMVVMTTRSLLMILEPIDRVKDIFRGLKGIKK
jgi:hypothetical protein